MCKFIHKVRAYVFLCFVLRLVFAVVSVLLEGEQCFKFGGVITLEIRVILGIFRLGCNWFREYLCYF